MKKGIPDALYEDIKEKYRKIADKRPDITQEKLNELFESEVKYYCKCQYKNVGLLQNKNVIKPTFLFCIFSLLPI